MKLAIDKYEMKKTLVEGVEINIPEEPIFFQEHNHRVYIGIFPQRAEWQNNEIWELQVVQITEGSIMRTHVRTNKNEIERELMRRGASRSAEDILKGKALDYVMTNMGAGYEVSQTQFEQRLNSFHQACVNLCGDKSPTPNALDILWTDEKVKEFAKVCTQGAYGEYKGCNTTEKKLQRFKELNL